MKIRRKFNRHIAGFTPRQMDAVRLLDTEKCKYLLYGGALGGGKSYLLRWWCARRLMDLAEMGFPGAEIMLACENYPSLRDRQLTKVKEEFPDWLGKMWTKHGVHDCCFILHPRYGGGKILFRNLDDPEKYKSSEFAAVAIDELTLNPLSVFEALRKRLRWKGLADTECKFLAGTNPTGIGAGWVKQFWIDRNLPKTWREPVDYTDTFAFVQSLASDNPFIDAAYEAQMSTYSEELQSALRYGSWNVTEGQAFGEVSLTTHALGKIVPADIPLNYQLYMTFDYGSGAPFSVGWWYTDNDMRLVRFQEWYGWTGVPNQGLGLPDREIARGIKEREAEWKINERDIIRLAGHDCGSKRPNPYGTLKGAPVTEEFAKEGVYLALSDPDRLVGARQFRQRIKTKVRGLPMLMAAASCEHFFRTIPTLMTRTSDQKGALEDIQEGRHVEDHVYDECRMMVTAIPMPEFNEEGFVETEEVGNSWDNAHARLQDAEEGDYESYDFYDMGLAVQ